MMAALELTFAGAMAQNTGDCQDMVKLRNRSGSLALALGKVDAGLTITVTQNADFTSQLMTTLLFENYMCQLNRILVEKGQAAIPRDTIDGWMDEFNSAYRTYDEATDNKPLGTLKAAFNAARDTVINPWKQAGAKTGVYQAKLPANVANEFLAAVPAINLTSVSGTGYLKTVISQGFSGGYESTIIRGEELTGNQLYALSTMRKSVALYAAGTTPAASMLRDITSGITMSLTQIYDRRSTALFKEQMKYDADAKAREAAKNNADQKIAELEKRLSTVEQKLKTN